MCTVSSNPKARGQQKAVIRVDLVLRIRTGPAQLEAYYYS
jgi:hypothetical protein